MMHNWLIKYGWAMTANTDRMRYKKEGNLKLGKNYCGGKSMKVELKARSQKLCIIILEC